MASYSDLERFHSRSMEYYAAGRRGEQGQLSPVRRFFCLFVTFDILFSGLLWLVCLVISTHSIITALREEVLQYSIYSSLFDIVMLAATRCIPLLLLYALIHIQHWWAVALTTLGTSAFLVAKVLLYDWEHSELNITFGVCLLLCSFVLSWGEVWLLDFRVLPRELEAQNIISMYYPNERTPLYPEYYPVPSVGGRSSYYSPLPSPTESESGGEEISIISIEQEGYRKKAKETKLLACNLLNSDGWQMETRSGDDIVYSKLTFNNKKVYKLVAAVSAAPDAVFEALYLRAEENPTWNHSLLYCEILESIDDKTDITYQIAAEAGGGIVSSRDFVILRTWEKRGPDYISAGISVSYPKMPPQKRYVRAENGPSAWIIESNPIDSNQCRFHWLLQTDLKGWIPQYLIDKTLGDVMLSYMKCLRNYLSGKSIQN